MNQIFVVDHPIALGKRIHAMRPNCPCKAAKLEPVEGVVQKVIQNQSGVWYFLSTGITVKAAWVDNVY